MKFYLHSEHASNDALSFTTIYRSKSGATPTIKEIKSAFVLQWNAHMRAGAKPSGARFFRTDEGVLEHIDAVDEKGKPIEILKDKQDVYMRVKNDAAWHKNPAEEIEMPAAAGDKPKQMAPAFVKLLKEHNDKAKEAMNQKKFNRAIEIYEQLKLLGLDKNNCLQQIGLIYLEADQFDRAIEYLEPIVLRLFPRDWELRSKLAEAYQGAKRYKEAISTYRIATELFQQNVLSKAASDRAVQIQYQNLRVRMGTCFYSMGEKQQAWAIASSVLKENQENLEGLIEYAVQVQDMHGSQDEEPLQVLLRVLITLQQAKQTESKLAKRVKKILAGMIKEKGGVEAFVKQLDKRDPAKLASAIAWVAVIVRDHSGIDQAIQLYETALKLNPQNVTCALNLAHAQELKLDYAAALRTIRDFCARTPDAAIRNFFSCKDFLDLTASINLEQLSKGNTENFRSGVDAQQFAASGQSLIWVDKQGSKLVPKDKVDEPASIDQASASIKYAPEELDLLALFYTGVKVLYAAGCLSVLPAICDKLELTRQGNDLHMTTIRNEHAYFSCISQLMTKIAPTLPQPALGDTQPIYVIGDSHALSTAWQFVTINGQQRLLKPVLVTGLKCWHLRTESDFYPKANFYNAIRTIPKGAEVVFLFGEIDCREGLYIAVEKLRYQSLEEGIQHTVSIYVNALKTLAKQYRWKIFVHAVMPTLDPTRPIVLKFNEVLHDQIVKQTPFTFVGDFVDQMLSEDHTQLKPQFALDGTHANPDYLRLFEVELTRKINNDAAKLQF